MKTCTKCREEKDISLFYRRADSRDGFHTMCKECQKASSADYHARNRERLHQKKKEWWEQNREQQRAKHREWYAENRDQTLQQQSARRMRLKIEAFRHYGSRCACCGEPDSRFLTLDHANNDGREHRKTIGTGAIIYRKLRDSGYPDDLGLRVLCFSCNSGRMVNGGVCPHEDPDPRFHV